nr:hypothetical protein [Tanacetum cinerariifolium]
MFECDEMFSSEIDESFPASPIYDRYQSGEGCHAVPPPYTGTFMPPKPDLVFHDAPTVNETVHTGFNVDLSPTKPDKDLSHTHRPSALIIEDWVSDSKDEFEAEPTENAPSFVQPTKQVKTPRPSVKPAEHPIPAPKIATPKPKTDSNIRNRKACFVCKSLTHLIKDFDYYEKKMAQTPARNHAQRGNFQQYAILTHPNPQRHVVPTAVLTRFKLVPLTAVKPVTTAVSPNNVIRTRPAKTVGTKPHSPPRRTINHRPSPLASNFFPKVTTIKTPKGNPQHALKDKGVIDSGCSRHITRNMSYLSDFEEINGGYLSFGGNPKGGKISGEENVQQYVIFPLWSSGSKDPHNTDGDATFEVKELDFEGRKTESKDHVSPSSSPKTKKHDDKTKREAKGKIPTVGQISTNNNNTFSAAGPSNTVVSPTLRESSYVDPSQYPDDPNMPALEDITYSDDEEDVGAEADFTNLETTITIRFEDPDYPDKVYQVVKALYGLHQAPKAWYETLTNYLLDNGFQKGKIDQTLFIKKQKGDILLVQQKPDGIFINQDKYVAEILRKFGLTDGKSASTPIDTEKPLLKDPDGVMDSESIAGLR